LDEKINKMQEQKEYHKKILQNIAIYMAEHTICDIDYKQIKEILEDMKKE